MVDATDRLRVDDCREELAGLLLEEVCRVYSPWCPERSSQCLLATYGSQLTGVSEQNRCGTLHVGTGSPRGEWATVSRGVLGNPVSMQRN